MSTQGSRRDLRVSRIFLLGFSVSSLKFLLARACALSLSLSLILSLIEKGELLAPEEKHDDEFAIATKCPVSSKSCLRGTLILVGRSRTVIRPFEISPESVRAH